MRSSTLERGSRRADASVALARSQVHQQKWRLTVIIAKVNDLQTQTKPCSYETVLAIDRELRDCASPLPSSLLLWLGAPAYLASSQSKRVCRPSFTAPRTPVSFQRTARTETPRHRSVKGTPSSRSS